MAPELRALGSGAAEVERVSKLMELAYGAPPRKSDTALFISLQPDGWFGIEEGDELVAAAGAISYGHFCWLGSVATHPRWRRRGFASELSRHLVKWAQEHGCATVALDASALGQPVYEPLGFKVVGDTVELALMGKTTAAHGVVGGVDALGPADSLDDLLAFDLEAFGGDRSCLLEALARDGTNRCLIASDRNGLCGYLMVRHGVLGPGCASEPAITGRLVAAALGGGAGPVVDATTRLMVPPESESLTTLQSLGFQVQRRLTHMRFGVEDLGGRRELVFAQTSYAAG
ncbi:MAG: family N-acetyltransferase [Acidimicrobiaceae bacterium]|nr:family N-acetyltransferase [Acidimicrobiaceae bacterium]